MLRIVGSRTAKTVLCAAAVAPPHQQQPLRSLVKKAATGGGNGGRVHGGSGNDHHRGNINTSSSGSGRFSLRLVWTRYDLEKEPYEEEILKFKSDATMGDVRDSLKENIGMVADDMESLEYFLNGQWKPFVDPSPLKGRKDVPIRHAKTFDDRCYDDEVVHGAENGDDNGADTNDDDDTDDEVEYGLDECKASASESDVDRLFDLPLATQIRAIVAELCNSDYVPDRQTQQVKSIRTGEIIPTRDFIIKLAMDDAALQKVLVSKVGCLDHIVRCVHFPFLWEEANSITMIVDEDD